MFEMVGVDKGEQPWQIINPSELLAPLYRGNFSGWSWENLSHFVVCKIG
jgi:hypothetical protein